MSHGNAEKALMQITFEVLEDLSITNSIKKKKSRYLYTAYSKYDDSIKLGYTDFLYSQLMKLEESGYKLNKARKGST